MNKTVAKNTGENFERQEKQQKNKAQKRGNRNKDRAVTENNLGSFANNVFVVRQHVFLHSHTYLSVSNTDRRTIPWKTAFMKLEAL